MKKYAVCPVCHKKPSFSFPFNIKPSGNGVIADIEIDEILLKVTNQAQPKGEISCCLPCRLFYNSKFFDEEELHQIYSQSYFLLEERIRHLDTFVYADQNFLSMYSKRIYDMVKHTEKKYNYKIETIYDIGGRDGFMLKDLAEERYQCTVLDPIPRQSCSPKVLKKDVWASDVACAEGVDLVLFCDVLAHCVDLKKEVKNLHNVLKEDGLLYVEVPYDIGTVFFWLFFLKWRGRNLPIDVTHFTYFSRRAMMRLLEENGFECLSTSYEKLPGSVNVTILSILAQKKQCNDPLRYKKQSTFFDLGQSNITVKWCKNILQWIKKTFLLRKS